MLVIQFKVKDIIIKKKSNQAAQQKKKSTISGIITDNYGEPIIGANIKEKMAQMGLSRILTVSSNLLLMKVTVC